MGDVGELTGGEHAGERVVGLGVGRKTGSRSRKAGVRPLGKTDERLLMVN